MMVSMVAIMMFLKMIMEAITMVILNVMIMVTMITMIIMIMMIMVTMITVTSELDQDDDHHFYAQVNQLDHDAYAPFLTDDNHNDEPIYKD